MDLAQRREHDWGRKKEKTMSGWRPGIKEVYVTRKWSPSVKEVYVTRTWSPGAKEVYIVNPQALP
jgi:hypothetical protein